ncbi:PepSY-associated TM helix domain-containing protein [Nitrospirillum viridazoti]|uniref:Peptidase n=1 Tax=Nitrospirillum viridazoti CBAmc TaxID=1441467 RepID=A0A248K0B9_9PROT|nr:PepSY-associated TM helix domain-containing protein [Nitrospirillum amazonense]ASG24392.1 peptidase [Nitrospirillum amazonense CBAmc]TWB33348.1 putative iron-regulated membrane protein [Nitrospirillum amazonense]
MSKALRAALLWPHTWMGVTLGGLLIVIFFMGSLTVFMPEIDRWMMPATRVAVPQTPVSLDAVARPLLEQLTAQRATGGATVRDWLVEMPDARTPVLQLRVRTSAGGAGMMATTTGRRLPPPGTLGASSFFYPLHYCLLLRPGFVGYWIVALAAVAMMAGLVSGVIIHARLFQDFFTFRPRAHPQRLLLDLHNLMGVLALPFHLMITFSGIAIILPVVFPAGTTLLYGGDMNRFYADAIGNYDRPAVGVAAPLLPLDPLVEQARRLWSAEIGKDVAVAQVGVVHPGDAGAYVRITRVNDDRVTLHNDPLYFDGITGVLLARGLPGPVVGAQRVIAGLHEVRFDHWTLRWLYFLQGLGGSVLIATGLLYWLEKRRARHGGRGWRVVAATACATTTGVVIATLAMLVANRLLPAALPSRELAEVAVFFLSWIGTALHAGLHLRWQLAPPWRTQAILVGGLALTAMVANWITTGDHPFHAWAAGHGAVLGVDAGLAATALTAFLAAWRLARRVRTRQGKAWGPDRLAVVSTGVENG